MGLIISRLYDTTIGDVEKKKVAIWFFRGLVEDGARRGEWKAYTGLFNKLIENAGEKREAFFTIWSSQIFDHVTNPWNRHRDYVIAVVWEGQYHD